MKLTTFDRKVYTIVFCSTLLITMLSLPFSVDSYAVIYTLVLCIILTLIVGTLVNLVIRLFKALDVYIENNKK